MNRAPWYAARWLTLTVPALLAVADALLANDLSSKVQVDTSLLAAAALLLRRRFPVPVLLATLPGMQLGYIWLAPMIALYAVSVECRRAVTGAAAAVVAVSEFVPWPWNELALSWDRTTALAAMYALLTGGAPVALGLLVRTRRELAVRLDELTRGQQRERDLLEQSVLARERARLAREMHDVVSHQVSLISIQAGALQVRAEDPAAVDQTARTIRQLAVKTLEELRQMVGVLRAAGGGDAGRLAPQPRLADLPRLITASGLDVDLELPGDGRIWPEPLERAAYRTVQEALTNVRKHAPGSAVTVRVAGDAARLRVSVRNGPGAPGAVALLLPSGGHGLIGLRERAQQLGGACVAEATDDGGFLVRADLPVIPPQAAP